MQAATNVSAGAVAGRIGMASSPGGHSVKGGLYRRHLKRPIDFGLSLCATTALSPVLLAVGVLVRVGLGTPIIYKQERPGLHEKVFTLYKFRTMTDERDEDGRLLPDEARLSRLGRLLRSTSLDELPQLFNVMKGDMAIVGPRPLAVVYLPYYDDTERRRHDARPGLSSSAAVRGRTTPSWEDQFACDVDYVDNITFCRDLAIVARTLAKVMRREGTTERGIPGASDFHRYRARQNESVSSHRTEVGGAADEPGGEQGSAQGSRTRGLGVSEGDGQ